MALSSWHDGHAKLAILDFVARVTLKGGAYFVPPADRIAVFDNDGTLWCEQPWQVQFFFGRDRLAALAQHDPSLAQRQPFKAYLENDQRTMHALGKKGLFEVSAAAHAGMTEAAFRKLARTWLITARHPSLGVPFPELYYRPQIELLAYLREHGFKTFIVSAGGIDLMRSFCEEIFGIPRERVIGSSLKTRFDIQSGLGELVKLAELNSFNDREEKVVNIGLHIGRRPILAFGNSDGDLAMLRYVRTGRAPSLALLLHHDDGAREFAYDRDFYLSPLNEALNRCVEYGLTLVSMKRDWRTVFGSAVPLTASGAAPARA
ncbi:MAG TPA: HAD family hydrolase [Rhizomicrobium sp.]|nr:HAD family hydrolase [Rhizomicrobium sp.]